MPSVNLSGPALEPLASSADSIEVTRANGEEALSEPFRYTVRFSVKSDKDTVPSPDFNKVVGRDASLEFVRGNRSRAVSGVVTKAQQKGLGANAKTKAASYLVEIRPRLWGLHLSRSHRTYADRKVVTPAGQDGGEIGALNDVLQEVGYTGDWIETHLTEDYSPRKHISQKGETDLAFFHRLAEEAGIVYYFKEDGTLVLLDHGGNQSYIDYERSSTTEGQQSPDTLKAVASQHRSHQEGVLNSYSLEQNVTPEYVEVRSVDFDQSTTVNKSAVPSEDTGDPSMGRGIQEMGGLTWETDTKPEKAWTGGMESCRIDQILGAKRRLRGHTHSYLLGAGMQFALEQSSCEDVLNHFDSPNDVNFVLGRLRLSYNTKQTSTAEKPVLHVEFEGIPATGRTYRGDRYLQRGEKKEDMSEEVKRRFDALASKYSALRDSMVTLKDIDVSIKVKPINKKGDKAAKGALLGDKEKRKLDIPARADGVDEVDPYRLDTEATVGPEPTNQGRAGLYEGTVTSLPANDSSEAKQGMVRVALDVDDGEEPVWARVITPWAGNRYGQQCLPREGDTVALMYPAEDAGDYPFIVGGLYDGSHKMPFADEPEKKTGIRTQSHRTSDGSDEYLHSEILAIDEPNEEEVRIMSPLYRTDVTGLEKDVGSEGSYFKFNKGKAPSGLTGREDFSPTAPRFVTKNEKKGHMPSKGDKVCKLKPLAIRIKEEYEGIERKEISNKEIKISNYPDNKKTKFKVKDSINDEIRNEIDTNITIDEFMYNLTDHKQVERKSSIEKDGEHKELWWYTVEKSDEISENISYDLYSKLPEKIKYNAVKSDVNSEAKSGINSLAKDMKKTSEGVYDKIDIISCVPRGDELVWGAKSLYEVVASREAYEVDQWGRDAYDVRPYQELYPSKKEINPLEHGDKNRAEYTEGGAIDACKGTYAIHSFGDRLEIFKASGEEQKDVFQRQFTEEWEVEELPGQEDQFEDDDPIMVLNKDGSIVIQSSEGINIESSDDINIQSGGSINMYAEEEIEERAEEELSIKSKEIKVGSRSNPHTRSIEHVSDHSLKTANNVEATHAQNALSISLENIVFTFAGVHMTTTGFHWINTAVGLKGEVFGSTNTVVKMKEFEALNSSDEVAKLGERVSRNEGNIAKVGNTLTNTKESLAGTQNQLSATQERLAQDEAKLTTTRNLAFMNAEAALQSKEIALFAAK